MSCPRSLFLALRSHTVRDGDPLHFLELVENTVVRKRPVSEPSDADIDGSIATSVHIAERSLGEGDKISSVIAPLCSSIAVSRCTRFESSNRSLLPHPESPGTEPRSTRFERRVRKRYHNDIKKFNIHLSLQGKDSGASKPHAYSQ